MKMSEPLPDRWSTRDLPVLVATARCLDAGEAIVQARDVADDIGLPSGDVEAAYDGLANLPMDLPSLDEQRRATAYLVSQIAKIDQLIAGTECFIELSCERRSALITAAVTGQIEVRGKVA